jgi:hypothetical protein
MSEHIRIILPISRPALLLVDGVFNELFKCQSRINPQRIKDFVVRSKGILYVNDTTADEEKYILRYATFLMTTDVEIWQTALEMKLPNAFISQCENRGPEMMVSNYESIEDERLKRGMVIAFENAI